MPQVGRLTELFAKLSGAQLCYGDPVHAGDRAVIPVASVRAVGGLGFGRGGEGVRLGEDDAERVDSGRGAESPEAEASAQAGGSGEGGGGGGTFTARPVGFIEISPEGTRFKRVLDPIALLGLPVILLLVRLLLNERRKRAEPARCRLRCCGRS